MYGVSDGYGEENETTNQKLGEVREFEPRWHVRDDKGRLLGILHEETLERVKDVTEFAQTVRLHFGDILESKYVPKDT